MRRASRSVAAPLLCLVAVVASGGCSTGAGTAGARPPTAAASSDPTAGATSEPNGTAGATGSAAVPDTVGATPEPTGGPWCETIELPAGGAVARPELTEASGLVASGTTPGVLWSHNDSGGGAGVFALDTAGRDLGYLELVSGGRALRAVDIEDIAIVGGTIYLADVGDNDAVRPTVTVHLFDEPAVDLDAGDPTDGTVEVSRSIEIRYPDGPTDAEAVLVDPTTADLLVLSKDLDDPDAPTRLHQVPGPVIDAAGQAGGPVPATVIGALDVAAMTATSARPSIGAALFPGAVTGADITPAGDLIALRTYGSVWLFARERGQSVAEALGGVPCEVTVPLETQGESVAFLPPEPGDDGAVRLATLGEGDHQPVNLTLAAITR